MVRILRNSCPSTYVEYSNACYYFGNHESYKNAVASCKENGARLVDVNPRNNKYIRDQVKLRGGSDNWIGSYYIQGKLIKRKGTQCPMMRGQNLGKGFFLQVNCNSAYPYICQKYGTVKQDRGLNFDLGKESLSEDFEIPVTSSNPEETTLPISEKTSSDSGVIAAVLSIIILIVLAVFIRYICNRRQAQKAKKDNVIEHKAATNMLPSLDRSDLLQNSSIVNGVSRTNTLNKPYSLPRSGPQTGISDFSRKLSVADTLHEREINHNSMQKSYRHQSGQSHLHNDAKRKSSRGFYENHSPPPAYGQIYQRNRRQRARARRRSMSEIETVTDGDLSMYSDSSRSSSSDSTMKRSRSFRHSSRFHEHQRSFRYNEPHQHDDETSWESRNFRHRSSSRSRTRQEPRTMYEDYAVRRPPSPASRVIARECENNYSKHRQTPISYRNEMRYRTGFQQSRYLNSSTPMYFPQMTNAWSHEDLRSPTEFDNNPDHTLPVVSLPRQTRAPFRQGPIRVNRHIHDFETSSFKDELQIQSQDSDHIYESLDEVNHRQQQANRDYTEMLHDQRLPTTQDVFTRNSQRASVTLRASLRNRCLPAIPVQN